MGDVTPGFGGGSIGFPSFNTGSGYNPFSLSGGQSTNPYDVFGTGNPMDPTGYFGGGSYGNTSGGSPGRSNTLGGGTTLYGDAARSFFSGLQDAQSEAMAQAAANAARRRVPQANG